MELEKVRHLQTCVFSYKGTLDRVSQGHFLV